MKLKLLTLLCFISVIGTAEIKETPLLKVADKTIALEEFEAIYGKNHQITQVPISKSEYLDLFIRYKLKVLEAQALGLDTAQAFRDEAQFYFDDLASQYLCDTIAEKQARESLRERLKWEVDASHILVKIDPRTPMDTADAWGKITKARERVLAGEDFAVVAKEVSEDPSAKQNSGRLGYFGPFQMVEEFEDATYNAEVGQVTEIFKTRFGYHFLIVHDKRPFEGQVLTAHIMKMVSKNASEADQAKAKAIIDSLYELVKSGEDFAKVAAMNSDDRQSGFRGGQLPWISRNQIVAEYSDVAFALNAGEYSEPVRSGFGWHIIKLLDRRAEHPEEDIDRMMEYAKKQNMALGQAGEKAKTTALKQKYNFRWNPDVRAEVITIMHTSANDAERTEKLKALTSPLATFNGGAIQINNMSLEEIAWNQNFSNDANFEQLAKNALFEREKQELPNMYPEFKYTMQEYYDGLLIFEINQQTVWNDSAVDSTMIIKQYESNKARYSATGTFNGKIYFFDSPQSEAQIAKIKAGDAKAVKSAVKVVEGEQAKGGIYDDFIWPIIPSKYVVAVGEITNGEPQELDAVRGQVISDCQQIAERQWTDKLKEKYNPQTLKKIK